MSYFDAVIDAKLQGRAVALARLVELDFVAGTGRYWEGGSGTLITPDGNSWLGAGELGSIGGIESALSGSAPITTLTLQGVSAVAAANLINADTNVKGQPVKIYIQYFDEVSLQPIESPYSIYVGVMDVMSGNIKGPNTSSIQVTCEGLFTKRARPPWGYYSDRSQQNLFKGDTGLSQMSAMLLANPFWPVF